MCCQLEFGAYNVSSVHVHTAICDNYLVSQYSIDLLSIGVGLYVSSVYVHSAICDTFCGVMVFHRAIVNRSGGICILSIRAFSDMCN